VDYAFENLQVEQEGAIVTVTVQRPKVLNALNHATLQELDALITQLSQDDSARGVILTGSGEKAFVAGADIRELKDNTPLSAKRIARDGQLLFTRLERLGKPVIAAINGFCLGGGLELACACTFRVASKNAILGLPEVKLGVIPGYGGTQRLPRLVGIGRAMELILTGESINAEQAERMGLVNHVFELEDLLPQTKEILGKILQRGPVAVRFALEAGFRGPDVALDEGLNLESNLFGLLTTTQDMHEGMAAFLEKRHANFQGK
jgi:enoyl-CoA hydratase